MDNLLTIIIFTPLLAALIMGFLLKGSDAAAMKNARYLGLYGTLATLFVALFLLAEFDRGDPGFQFVEHHAWYFGLSYKVGVDGISAVLVLATVLIMPVVILSTWTMTHRVKELMIGLLTLQTTVLGALAALDLALFFVLALGSAVLLVLVIGVWGRDASAAAATKLALYTALGGAVLGAAMVAMARTGPGADIADLVIHNFSTAPVSVLGFAIPGGMQGVMLIGLLVGAAVWTAAWPYHAWLPQALHQAPPVAAFVAVALVAKLGAYALIRLGLPVFPVAGQAMQPIWLWLAAVGTVWAALVALVQTDLRRILAYGFTAHMGLVLMGILSATQQGLDGAILLLLAGGVVFGGLAVAVQIITDRGADASLTNLGGLIQRMPHFAGLMAVFVLGLMIVPGTGSFAGVFLVVLGAFGAAPAAVLVACIGVPVLAAVGWGMYRRAMLGELMRASLKGLSDVTPREALVLSLLALGIIGLGLAPGALLEFTDTTVAGLLDARAAALAATN